MDDPTAVRAGLNEAAFRRVNEGIRAGTGLADATRAFGFVCECAVVGCNQVIELTLPEYERVRRYPRRFVVAVGHDLPEVERVVERRGDHTVVEKLDGPATAVVEATDPRR